ncbi:MAG: hypothetical protein ACOY46_17295 [Bacillota bacterium]
MKRNLLLAIIIAVLCMSAGCAAQKAKPQEQVQNKQPVAEKPAGQIMSDYFPLSVGSLWVYQGEGNEYASFSREVLFNKGNRAQIREDNGGTVSAMIFEVTDNAVTRIYNQAEMYDRNNLLDLKPNDNTVILKGPLDVGTKWNETGGQREIVDTNAAVDTPLGVFDKCVKVKITGQHSTVFEYFKREVGMVKREFFSEGNEVSSVLKEFNKGGK